MPWEGGNSSSGTRLSAFGGEDFGYYAKDDAKERLHFLFAQIEKEFDALYMENLNRKPPPQACHELTITINEPLFQSKRSSRPRMERHRQRLQVERVVVEEEEESVVLLVAASLPAQESHESSTSRVTEVPRRTSSPALEEVGVTVVVVLLAVWQWAVPHRICQRLP